MYVARSNSRISANTRLGDDRYLEFRARIRKKRERGCPSKGGRIEGRHGSRGDGDRQFRNFSSRNYCKSRKGTSIVRRLFTSISIRIINLGRVTRSLEFNSSASRLSVSEANKFEFNTSQHPFCHASFVGF